MMGQVMFMRKGEVHTAPVQGLLLRDISEGSIVKLNENGSPVEFYVAKHNYESALNGEGRTLLVRRYLLDAIQEYDDDQSNVFDGSTMDTWFNSEYLSRFTADAQGLIGTTLFYNTVGGGNSTITTFKKAVFALSFAEYGLSATYANAVGTAVPIAVSIRVAKTSDGTACIHWTRDPYKSGTTNACFIQPSGAASGSTANRGVSRYRPAFTLPSTAKFDPDTLLFKEA